MHLTEQQNRWIKELIAAGYEECWARRRIILIRSQANVNYLKKVNKIDHIFPAIYGG